MSQLNIGTCSWKFDSWRGLVYSDMTNKEDYLREYAKTFDTVEIDQWFWSLHGIDKVTLPRSDAVEEYVDAAPEHFTFSIKVPNSITLTHFYKHIKRDAGQENPYFLSHDLFNTFLKTLARPMRSRLGPLMFQFEYLNKQKMPSQAEFQEKFAAFLSRCPRGYSYAVEIRNPNYLNPAYFTFLHRNKLTHVFLQGYYMPPIFPLYETFSEYIEHDTIIRLHGPDRKGIEEKSQGKWNQLFEPKDDELTAVAQMIQHLLSRNVNVYLNVNNHYEGSAPLTINRIKANLSNMIWLQQSA